MNCMWTVSFLCLAALFWISPACSQGNSSMMMENVSTQKPNSTSQNSTRLSNTTLSINATAMTSMQLTPFSSSVFKVTTSMMSSDGKSTSSSSRTTGRNGSSTQMSSSASPISMTTLESTSSHAPSSTSTVSSLLSNSMEHPSSISSSSITKTMISSSTSKSRSPYRDPTSTSSSSATMDIGQLPTTDSGQLPSTPPLQTPSPSTTMAGSLDSATIIGIALGGATAFIAFVVVILIFVIFFHYRKKMKSSSHNFMGGQDVTGNSRTYETPSLVFSNTNGVESPVAYATTAELRYVDHTNLPTEVEHNTMTASVRQDHEGHSSDTPDTAEPQMYETAVSSNSHNPPTKEATPTYEEPRDSIAKFQHSLEVDETAQQPYEVPIRTSYREDRNSILSASMGSQDTNRASFGHRIGSESYNHATSPGVRNEEPIPYAEPVTTTPSNTPNDSHVYFILDRSQKQEQNEPNDEEPFYFELENHDRCRESLSPEANENVYAELKDKDTNKNGSDHSDLQHNESVPSEEDHEEATSEPDENLYYVIEGY